jgi:hypothetical protein
MMYRMAVVGSCGLLAVALTQPASGPQTYRGLEITVTSVERAPNASLKDCPPGSNTVNAVTRPGEQFALVTVAFKVSSDFQPSPQAAQAAQAAQASQASQASMKRPSVTDTAGKTYNTAAAFVDVGAVPQYSCTFPFRVPDGTRLKSLQIESVSFDLSSLDVR